MFSRIKLWMSDKRLTASLAYVGGNVNGVSDIVYRQVVTVH